MCNSHVHLNKVKHISKNEAYYLLSNIPSHNRAAWAGKASPEGATSLRPASLSVPCSAPPFTATQNTPAIYQTGNNASPGHQCCSTFPWQNRTPPSRAVRTNFQEVFYSLEDPGHVKTGKEHGTVLCIFTSKRILVITLIFLSFVYGLLGLASFNTAVCV